MIMLSDFYSKNGRLRLSYCCSKWNDTNDNVVYPEYPRIIIT